MGWVQSKSSLRTDPSGDAGQGLLGNQVTQLNHDPRRFRVDRQHGRARSPDRPRWGRAGKRFPCRPRRRWPDPRSGIRDPACTAGDRSRSASCTKPRRTSPCTRSPGAKLHPPARDHPANGTTAYRPSNPPTMFLLPIGKSSVCPTRCLTWKRGKWPCRGKPGAGTAGRTRTGRWNRPAGSGLERDGHRARGTSASRRWSGRRPQAAPLALAPQHCTDPSCKDRAGVLSGGIRPPAR